MPRIETWIPLTGRLLSRAGAVGEGDPVNPVRFALDTSDIALIDGEEMSMQWMEPDWGAGQVKVSIDAPARVLALLKSQHGLEASTRPLSRTRKDTILAAVNLPAMEEV